MNLDAAIVGIGCSQFGRALPQSQLHLAAIAFKEALGLDIRYVNQSWLHGRFVTNALQHAALAVAAGLADVVACVTAVSFTRERGFLGGPSDIEGNREEGGTHGEAPPYGLTAPAGGAAIAMQ